jgi:hypothetical protein
VNPPQRAEPVRRRSLLAGELFSDALETQDDATITDPSIASDDEEEKAQVFEEGRLTQARKLDPASIPIPNYVTVPDTVPLEPYQRPAYYIRYVGECQKMCYKVF